MEIAGKEGQEPIESMAENLIRNFNFADGKTGWRYDGAFTRYKAEKILAYIDPGEATYLAQTVRIPTTGYYKLQASFYSIEDHGAEFGVRFPDGSNILRCEVCKSMEPLTHMLEGMLLEKGALVEVYFTGINSNDKRVELEYVGLTRDIGNTNSPLPELANIVFAAVPNQIGLASIDTAAKRVTVTVPFGTNVKTIVPQFILSEGAQISPAAGVGQDFTNPVTYTITGEKGGTQNWTIYCKVVDREITIDSPNAKITEAFNWAKSKAKSYVRTEMRGLINRDEFLTNSPELKAYMPSYWAGYAHRYAFYARDLAHQMSGAHLLGLDRENFAMLKAFAATANEQVKWYPAWALNFDGSIFKLDYHNEDHFVREVPAVFELVEKACKMYLWTGDQNYVNDEVLWNYYSKAVTDFISLHDHQIPNGVAEGTGLGIFDGAASYDESIGEAIVESGDGIAAQYQAYVAYAHLSKEKGDLAKHQEFVHKAQELKDYFNTDWGVKDTLHGYVRGYEAGGKLYNDFGREASWFMPMKQITEAGERTDSFLELIDRMCETSEQAPKNIEAYTYLPDTFFPYGKNEVAWKWMTYIIDRRNEAHEVRSQGSNGDYPEVSYTLISQTVEGLMGITPNAPQHRVETISRLPEEITWLAINHITLGEQDIYVKHEGTIKSTLQNNAGPNSIVWEAQFAGHYRYILVNGEQIPAKTRIINGISISYATIEVPVGHSVTAVLINDECGFSTL